MRLVAIFVNGILHCLAINGYRLIRVPPSLVPCRQCAVQCTGFNAHQTIANDKLARHAIDAIHTAATKVDCSEGMQIVCCTLLHSDGIFKTV